MEYILPAIRELPSRQKEAATYPYNPKVRNRLERSSERSDKAGAHKFTQEDKAACAPTIRMSVKNGIPCTVFHHTKKNR